MNSSQEGFLNPLLKARTRISSAARRLTLAKRQDGVLQGRHIGVSEGRSGAVEPSILPGERRDTLSVAVCYPRRPGEPCRRLDEVADADRKRPHGNNGGRHHLSPPRSYHGAQVHASCITFAFSGSDPIEEP